ncbi:hypothetical protein LL912_00740 [Niabella sp. CC-SYL272]|uniref:hypothetical protein n=1 Tax=Niabella agricola TaxID=2891571 RepID=UPI001F26EABC|nr:hypothetical protein [Niabella agricola]MCF3107293.1 hypothetical protein [Niabella agricola]
MENKQTDLLQQVKDEVLYKSTDYEISGEEVDEVAQRYAEAYHAARIQEQGEATGNDIAPYLVAWHDKGGYPDNSPEGKNVQQQAMKPLNSNNRQAVVGECFTKSDIIDILDLHINETVSRLNTRAAEYAAGKVAWMYTEEQVREAMYHTYVNGPGHDSYADFEDGVIAKIKQSK